MSDEKLANKKLFFLSFQVGRTTVSQLEAGHGVPRTSKLEFQLKAITDTFVSVT